MERKEIIRKILCIIFSFLLSVMLFVTSLTAIAQFTLLDRDYFAQRLVKSGYINLLHRELVDELANEGYVSGFDEAFFEKLITVDDIKAPVLSAADKIYGEGEYKSAPKDEITEKFATAFIENLESRDVEIDEVQREHIQSFATECAEFFSENARLPFISIGESVLKTAIPLVKYMLIFTAAFALFCIAFLAFTSPKSEGALRYYSYSFGGASLMLVVPSALMLITGVFKKISIADKALYFLVQSIATNLLSIALITAIIFAVIWIATAIVTQKHVKR